MRRERNYRITSLKNAIDTMVVTAISASAYLIKPSFLEESRQNQLFPRDLSRHEWTADDSMTQMQKGLNSQRGSKLSCRPVGKRETIQQFRSLLYDQLRLLRIAIP